MSRTRQEHLRLSILLFGVLVGFALIGARLVHLQVIKHGEYSEIVKRQSTGRIEIPGERGQLCDRNGKVVATNIKVPSLYAYPMNRHELHMVAAFLDRFYGYREGTAEKRHRLRINRFSWIERGMSERRAKLVEGDAPRGLYLRYETRRDYPFGLIGRQVIGFTDIDNKGLAGVEHAFNGELNGTTGTADYRRDGRSNTYRIRESALKQPKPGQSLVLTLDWYLQELVEEELARGVREYNAEYGMAAFIDCHTGEVLAIADYDPNEPNPERPVKLRAVADLWEPGSIFKIFSAAGLLDAGIVKYDDSIYCEMGQWRVNGQTLEDDKELGWVDFRTMFELSSNIGFAKLAIELGGENLANSVKKFGIGKKTDVGLPSEASGALAEPGRWSDYNVAALAMGHAVSTTALQMAVAVGAVANGGTLLQPSIVLGQIDDDGWVKRRHRIVELGRAMKQSSADSLRAFMRGVVVNGTATKAQSDVVAVAGKTGTAQIFNHETRRYWNSRFIASFAGFFPYEKPQIAGVVMYYNPQPVHYGGWTAGPSFTRIAERFAIANPSLLSAAPQVIAVEQSPLRQTVETPNLIGQTVEIARATAEQYGLSLKVDQEEGFISWQMPRPDQLILAGEQVFVGVKSLESEELTMGDLSGMTLRNAAAYLHQAGIKYTIRGHGRVVKQSLQPGVPVNRTSTCQVVCKPL